MTIDPLPNAVHLQRILQILQTPSSLSVLKPNRDGIGSTNVSQHTNALQAQMNQLNQSAVMSPASSKSQSHVNSLDSPTDSSNSRVVVISCDIWKQFLDYSLCALERSMEEVRSHPSQQDSEMQELSSRNAYQDEMKSLQEANHSLQGTLSQLQQEVAIYQDQVLND